MQKLDQASAKGGKFADYTKGEKQEMTDEDKNKDADDSSFKNKPGQPAPPPDKMDVQQGVNGFDFVQEAVDDTTTLQVNGWPVLVNPESVLDINEMGAAHIALNVLVGPDDISLT